MQQSSRDYILSIFNKNKDRVCIKSLDVKINFNKGFLYNVYNICLLNSVTPKTIVFYADDLFSNEISVHINYHIENNKALNLYSYRDILNVLLHNQSSKDIYKLISSFFVFLSYDKSVVVDTYRTLKENNLLSNDAIIYLRKCLKYEYLIHTLDIDDNEEQTVFDENFFVSYNIETEKKKEKYKTFIKNVNKEDTLCLDEQLTDNKEIKRITHKVYYKFDTPINNLEFLFDADLDYDFPAVTTTNDKMGSVYKVYMNDDYPIDKINVIKKDGTYIYMCISTDAVYHKLQSNKLNKYIRSIDGKISNISIITIKVQLSGIILDYKCNFSKTPIELIDTIKEKFNIKSKGVLIEYNMKYEMETNMYINPMLFIDMYDTSPEFKSNLINGTIIYNETETTLAHKKFFRCEVNYGGVTFKLKLSNYNISNKQKPTILEIKYISNNLDKNMIIKYCLNLIELYKANLELHKKYYDQLDIKYYPETFSINSKDKNIIGMSRYVYSTKDSRPIKIEDDFDYESVDNEHQIVEFNGENYLIAKNMKMNIIKNTKIRTGSDDLYVLKVTKSGQIRQSKGHNTVMNLNVVLHEGQYGIVPLFFSNILLNSGQIMRYGVKNNSFIECLRYALDIKESFEEIKENFFNTEDFNIVRQENTYYKDAKSIEKSFRSSYNDICSKKYIRLFENKYNCNIMIVIIKNNKLMLETNQYDHENYIWYPENTFRWIIILKNTNIISGSEYIIPHDLIVLKNGTNYKKIFKEVYCELRTIKYKIVDYKTVVPTNINEYDYQFISNKNICRMIGKKHGSEIIWMSCYDRPLPLKLKEIRNIDLKDLEFIISHIQDLNQEHYDENLISYNILDESKILGIWYDDVYFPTKMKEINKNNKKLKVGPIFDEVNIIYESRQKDVTMFINRLFITKNISYNYLNSHMKEEDFINNYITYNDNDIDCDYLIQDYKSLPTTLYKNNKLLIHKSQKYKVESICKISKKNPHAYNEYSQFIENRNTDHKTFFDFSDLETWLYIHLEYINNIITEIPI
ncbi:hypothetical protein HDU92_007750 [Lobulomyces angularis]|nr:hypothetical protein HDU92_007750 [Lobulomyces angularis]